jgi:Domain of unknown function (DUF5615)
VKFLADENFNNDVIRGILRRNPTIDLIRAQDVGLSSTPDPIILEWCAKEGRILLTHDVATMTRYAYERVTANLPMPGVFEVTRQVPIGVAIEEIVMIAECSEANEWEGQVSYLPLR